MKTISELMDRSASLHAHLCPRQVLGVRMGMLAGKTLGLDLPQKNKRLHVFMESDGCAADGVSAATGCWVGRRTMHVYDYGKIAATFVDSTSGKAVRIFPHPAARKSWRRYAPDARSRWHGYLAAYQTMPDEELLVVQEVSLTLSMEAVISRPSVRAICAACGEEIFNQREVFQDGLTLCQGCAGETYYRVDAAQGGSERRMPDGRSVPVVSIVGRSGSGKTTVIEKLISGLKQRGFQVGTVKHHAHPGIDVDHPGKDTWRHAQAGSDHVVIAAPDRVVSIRRVEEDPSIDDVTAGMSDVDIILTDGYRLGSMPKVEVVRSERSRETLCGPEELLAVVADFELEIGVPRFDPDRISELLDFIEARLLRQPGSNREG